MRTKLLVVFRRYDRSIGNLFDYAVLCDQTLCFDNSVSRITPIFSMNNGVIDIVDHTIYARIMEHCHES